MSKKKTVGMMMKGRLAKSRCSNVRVSGKMLVFVSEVRYLGVRISEQMNFGVHVKGLREKVTNIVNGIKRVMRKKWDLRRDKESYKERMGFEEENGESYLQRSVDCMCDVWRSRVV